MRTSQENASSPEGLLPLTKHAWERMTARRLSSEAIAAVLAYGRIVRIRGAEIYAIGRREIERFKADGIDLSRLGGVHVVCSRDGAIVTVYRNHDLRSLRSHGLRSNHRLAA